MTGEYWDGALWVYHADITNGGGGAGDHVYTIVPGAGNELELLYGRVINQDTTARTVTIVIDDGSNDLVRIMTLALSGGAAAGFPTAEVQATTGNSTSLVRYIISGTMRLVVAIAAVALSQDTVLGLVCRIRGGLPTVTEVGASTPTININTEQVF